MATFHPGPDDALLLVTAALVAVVAAGRASESDVGTFTGEFAALGSITIRDALDAADAAFGRDRTAAKGDANG